MFRQLNLLWMGCVLSGCLSVPPFAKLSGHPERRTSDKRPLINDLSMDDLREIEAELFLDAQKIAGVPRNSIEFDDRDKQAIDDMEGEFLREQITSTLRGSQVGIYDEFGGRYTGTVLRAGPKQVEIMNCISQEVIPGPDGQRQCKTSHIPFLTVDTSAVTHFVTISPPPSDFPATNDEIDGTEYSVAEIVNRSGQRQRWGRPPVKSESNRGTASLAPE